MNQDWMKNNSRPLLTIVGIIVFFLNYCALPIILRFLGKDATPFEIPTEVIIGYFSVVGIYGLGRSAEKIIGEKSAKQE